MTLTRKLLASYLAVVAVTALTLIVAADRLLRGRLEHEATLELEREGRYFAAALETPGARPDSLVLRLAAATGRRLTVVDRAGRVIADSDFPPGQLATLENHASRPEIRAAYEGRTGVDLRLSASTGRAELKVAVPFAGGVARVSSPLPQVDAVVRRAQGAILLGALVATTVAGLLALGFSRGVSRPLVRLSAAAQSIAGGGHPAVDPRGGDEVGDLARALRTVDENLTARLTLLQEERGRMEALITSMVEGVLACDPDGTVRSMNPAARRLLGLGDAAAPRARELFRQRAAREAVELTLSGGTVDGREVDLDGRHILLSGRGLPGGGAVFVLHDITTLKRLELVRRDFVANVSHELRTPLTVVRGYAETLVTDDPPEATRAQFLAAILDNAQRMQRLIDDLLDLSRIESHAWEPRPAAVELEPLARDAWRAVGGKPRLEIAVAEGCAVRADPDAVRQILTNLLENANRYTPPEGTVTVRAARSGDRIRVEVVDTGAGIPGEHLPRIFERFYRVDPHRSREAGGTGLGLAIVKHLVEAHGGQVEAESRLGAGTTIRFTLPAS